MRFRKTLSTVICVVIAQTASAKGLQIGIESGMNISRLRFAPTNAIGTNKILNKSGAVIGILLDVPLAKNISFETGLLYSRKGVRLTSSYFGSSIEIRYRYNYIEVPLYGQYRYRGFFAAVGPYFAVVAGASFKGIMVDTTVTEKIEVGNDPNTDGVRRMDAGLNFKAGYQLPVGLFFSAKYGLGLTNILPGAGLTGQNNVIGLSVGYNFFKHI